MGDKTKGLYAKFSNVTRTDGSSAPGGKHHGCEYFILDRTHDPFARPALLVYADACEAEYPLLAADLRRDAPTPAEEPRISVYALDAEDWSLGVWYADGGHFTEEGMRAEVEAEMRSAHGDDAGRWDDAAREDLATLERKAVLTHGWQQRGFVREGEMRPLSALAWEEVVTALDGGEEGDALQVRECAPDAEHAIPYTGIDLIDDRDS